MRIFLNPDIVFRQMHELTCIYNAATGLFFWGSKSDAAFLSSFRNGREMTAIAPADRESELSQFIPALINDCFLIPESEKGKEERESSYAKLFPARTLFTVYYEHKNEQGNGAIDIAVNRTGKHGEADFEVLALKEDDAVLWKLCDGGRRVNEIVSILGIEKANRVMENLRKWTAPDAQIARLLPQPLEKYRNIPEPLLFPAPFFPQRKEEAAQVSIAGDKEVKAYHLKTIKKGYRQFERIESTLSHIYRVQHPILGGRSYGEMLFSRLSEIKQIERGCKIIEVGGGHGDISKEILLSLKKTKPEIFQSIKYVICDLSPALISSQRTLHRSFEVKAEHVHCDGESMPLKDSSVDILVSNEVIADFSTPEFTLKEAKRLAEKEGIPIDSSFIEQLKNAAKPQAKFRLNLGAFKLLKEVRRILKQEGVAVITEYGYENVLPFMAQHLDHAEYTINFTHLRQIAEALGMKTGLVNAFDFFGFRDDVELITHPSFMAAFRLLEHSNIHLPNLVYTRELLKSELEKAGLNPESLKNIQFVKAAREPIEIVKVLICRKN